MLAEQRYKILFIQYVKEHLILTFYTTSPAQEAFLKEYSGNAAAADLIAGQRHEQSLYDKYKEYYGYVFYIGQKR